MFSIGQHLKRLHKIMCKPSCTSSSRASVKNRNFWQAIKKHCIIHREGCKTPPRGSLFQSRRTENGDEKKNAGFLKLKVHSERLL